jgi:hypothetical protein
MSEQTARFEHLVARIGLALATVVAKDSLPAGFLKGLALKDLIGVYKVVGNSDPEFQAVVLRKIRDTAEPFGTVAEALVTVIDVKLRLVLQRRLFNTAKTFGHYQIIFEAGSDTKYGKLAFQRLCRLVTTKQGKRYVSENIDKRSALYSELMFSLERTAQSFADECFVWSLNRDSQLGERAFKRMMRVGTFSDWIQFLSRPGNREVSSPVALGEIFGRCLVLAGNDFEMLSSLASAHTVYGDLERAVGVNALDRLHNQLIANAVGADQLTEVYRVCRARLVQGHREVIARRLMAEANTVGELGRLYHEVPECGSLVLERMRELYAKER